MIVNQLIIVICSHRSKRETAVGIAVQRWTALHSGQVLNASKVVPASDALKHPSMRLELCTHTSLYYRLRDND